MYNIVLLDNVHLFPPVKLDDSEKTDGPPRK